jgi:hypothetical protein
MELLTVNFSPVLYYFGPNTLPSTIFTNTVKFFLVVGDRVSHPYEVTGKLCM